MKQVEITELPLVPTRKYLLFELLTGGKMIPIVAAVGSRNTRLTGTYNMDFV